MDLEMPLNIMVMFIFPFFAKKYEEKLQLKMVNWSSSFKVLALLEKFRYPKIAKQGQNSWFFDIFCRFIKEISMNSNKISERMILKTPLILQPY